MKKLSVRDPKRQAVKARRFYISAVLTIALTTILTGPAFAAGDPLDVINSLSDFVFACIRALGVIVLGWGLVNLGMSFQSHDPSQRTQGFLCLFGGLVITFAKEILGSIGAV